jgi:hypothetical protein
LNGPLSPFSLWRWDCTELNGQKRHTTVSKTITFFLFSGDNEAGGILLLYVPKAQKEKKILMVAWWATIWKGGLKSPVFLVLTDEDKAKLEELKSMEIHMSQTAIGDMNQEEQKKLRRNLDKINTAAALGNTMGKWTQSNH